MCGIIGIASNKLVASNIVQSLKIVSQMRPSKFIRKNLAKKLEKITY